MLEAPLIDVVVEIPRGSFLKRGSTGRVDFVSPLRCPFNYGSVPQLIGLEGGLLDALVLGPRLPVGARVRVPAWGAVSQTDRGMMDHKLICADEAPDERQRNAVLRFFHVYAVAKGLLNLVRGAPGRNGCDGWIEAREALNCAKPRDASWHGSSVKF
jgi:inorganic pyrophosphatase